MTGTPSTKKTKPANARRRGESRRMRTADPRKSTTRLPARSQACGSRAITTVVSLGALLTKSIGILQGRKQAKRMQQDDSQQLTAKRALATIRNQSAELASTTNSDCRFRLSLCRTMEKIA